MSRAEVVIAGFGGQGIMLAGYILGYAATIYDRKNAVQMESYGPEARGGAAKTELIISTEEIDYPIVEEPDILVVMSQEAYTRYHSKVKSNGTLIIDEDLVDLTPPPPPGVSVYKVPATRIAEALGRRIVANMVMLGALCAITKVVSPKAMEEAIKSRVPKGTEELNIKAFRAGYDFAIRLMRGEVD